VNSLRRTRAIVQNDLDLLRYDPLATIVLIITPLLVMAFLKPAYGPLLHDQGYGFANGSEQVVPGMAVFFAIYMITFLGLAFFREHIWSTWDRLRASPARSYEIVIGKLAPNFAILVVQQAVLFGAGVLLFGLEINGSVVALAAVALSFVLWLIAFAFAVASYCRTFQQVLAVSNLGAILFSGIGGALTPIDSLPGWADAIAPGFPTYWAMRGFKDVLLDGEGLGGVGPEVAVLLGAAALFWVLAAVRFRLDDPKGGTL
jgi:ABC-2 type transport system permease protein